VSQAITTAGLISAIGAAFDANNNLIVANDPKTSNLLVFAPPYTGAPTVTTPGVAGTAYRKIALNGTQLFVANVNAGTGTVDVYNLPLTNTSAPAFSMTNVNVPEAVAFDKSGNLYVGNANDGTIRVFAPPFAAASTPSLTFTMPAGFNIFGMTIGR
jgi:hypothetical protein